MTKSRFVLFGLAVLFLLAAVNQSYAQDDWWKDKKYKSEWARQKAYLCKKTFKDIANGLSASSISVISQYFGDEVFLDLISFEKDYYSAGQAEIILNNFMNYFRVISFRYRNSFYKNSYSFATGRYLYDIGEGRRELKVSVSLKYRNDQWYVDQININ